MAKKTKDRKNARAKSNDKLEALKDLPKCMVVLHNIAVDKDLVQRYQLRFSEKKKEELEHSSPCINTPKNSNWMLKDNVREDNTADETTRITRSCLKKFTEKKNEECTNLKLLNDVSYNRCPKVIQPGFVAQKQQLKRDTSIKSLSNKSYDQISSVSSNTYCSLTQEKIVPVNNKSRRNKKKSTKGKKDRSERKYVDKSVGTSLESVNFDSDGDTYLDAKTLTVTDYNSKMQEISNEAHPVEAPQKSNTECYSIKKHNNDTLYKAAIAGGAVCKVKLEHFPLNIGKNKSVKDVFPNTNNTEDVENKFSGTSEDVKTNFKSKNANLSDNVLTTYNNINGSQDQKEIYARTKSSDTSLTTDSTMQVTGVSEAFVSKPICSTAPETNGTTVLSEFLTTCNKKQCANKTNNNKKKLPKITGNHILPKGTVKIMKVNMSDKSLQNSFSKQVFLEQDRYNTNSNLKQVSCVDNDNTLGSTNILRKKEHYTSEINRSMDMLDMSESTSALNSINLRNENIDNKKLHGTKIDHKNDSLIELRNNNHNNVNANDTDSKTTYEDYTLNHQEQSNKLDDEHESNILQGDKKCNKNFDKSILNKNTSNLMDVDESFNVNGSLILVNKEKLIRQNRKRKAEDTIHMNLISKRRLNRTTWQQNNAACAKSLSQEFNEFSNSDTTVTLESNIVEENNSKEQKTEQDLRERLNKKRSKPSPKLSTSEDKLNNKNNVESKQIDLNNENDISASTSTMKNKKFCRRLFFDEEPVSSKTLDKEKDIQTDLVCSNHMDCPSSPKETQHINQIDKSIYEDTNIRKKYTTGGNKDKDDDDDDDDNDDDDDDDDDDDCISLFAESFDTNLSENAILSEQSKPRRSLYSNVPQVMSFLNEQNKPSKSLHSAVPRVTSTFLNEQNKPSKSLHSDVPRATSTFLSEQNEPSKSLHSDVPYIMTTSSFNKYIKQNATEFNKEYEKFEEDDTEEWNKTDETKREFNNQLRRTTDCVPEIKTVSKIPPLIQNIEMVKSQWVRKNIKNKIPSLVNGYCYTLLKRGICYNQGYCRYMHDLQELVNGIYSEDSGAILDTMKETLESGYSFLCRMIYSKSLQKLTIDQILTMYRMFHTGELLTLSTKNYITNNTITELLNRQMSLKTIVDRLVDYITPITNSNNLTNILRCIEKNIKPNEYWNTVRTLILKVSPDIIPQHIIQKILVECMLNEKFTDIQDVNDNLIRKVRLSTLDKNVIEHFKSLVAGKTANNSHPPAVVVQNFRESLSEPIASQSSHPPAVLVQNFGERLSETIASQSSHPPAVLVQNFGERLSETIASPDGNGSQIESPKRSSTFIDKSTNENEDHIAKVNGESYTLRLIDDLSEARSAYRDHKHLWKFYVDLERFKKGLLHQDYDYVINILKNYSEMQDETTLFVRSCCSILRTEVKRSEYHLANIIRRTVQMGTFNILGKILFEIGLDILTNLVDKEAWGLALWLIQSLHMYNLPYNAEYFLLTAEIYLANKEVIKAYDLLKYQNIICTSRDKWYVKSTISDERVRNKIMHILLDSFCNEFIEHAVFIFQFLLKDQYSQYYPIDLSCYVEKLIILSLSKKDTNLIIEMANLILKYTFALSTTTCRALIATLTHLDEGLARQIYNYAEGIGVYPTMKLWPVTYIIINNDLTEEEIYLIFLQLLKNLMINFGHAIEFAKPQSIKVYLILEIKYTEQLYCAELQNYYNNKAITNLRTLIRNVLKTRFDPPLVLMSSRKGRIYKLQSKSIINYLKTEHCN
ncbi:uncharacterized protein [Temnothorax longispinosus]|uniref:uncharacterized protein n=1 Tax=Temnothorax longispinosus TaxID=300112 RepID=UPI003A99CB82